MKPTEDIKEFAKKDLERRKKQYGSALYEEEPRPSKPLSKSI